MTESPAEPEHLDNRHRDTLRQIFQHPVSHNIEWHAVESLLAKVGTVEHEHDGRFKVTLGDEIETFDKPKHKDIDAQQVVDLRRMLTRAGYQLDADGTHVTEPAPVSTRNPSEKSQ